MDRMNLVQALRDAEIANARVIDLTARLLEAEDEVQQLRQSREAEVAAELGRLREARERISSLETQVERLAAELEIAKGLKAQSAGPDGTRAVNRLVFRRYS